MRLSSSALRGSALCKDSAERLIGASEVTVSKRPCVREPIRTSRRGLRNTLEELQQAAENAVRSTITSDHDTAATRAVSSIEIFATANIRSMQEFSPDFSQDLTAIKQLTTSELTLTPAPTTDEAHMTRMFPLHFRSSSCARKCFPVTAANARSNSMTSRIFCVPLIGGSPAPRGGKHQVR